MWLHSRFHIFCAHTHDVMFLENLPRLKNKAELKVTDRFLLLKE